MSLSAQLEDEGSPFTAGSSEKTDTQNDNTCIQIHTSTCCIQTAASCCKDRHHRKLAISSIICGISCIGIVALINSVKAREAHDPERAKHYSRRARHFSIISITVWVAVLVFTPLLVGLVSYLFTLID